VAEHLVLLEALAADWPAMLVSKMKRIKVDVGILQDIDLGYPQEYVFVQLSMCASEFFHKAFLISRIYSFM
jgi:hypothetical protein